MPAPPKLGVNAIGELMAALAEAGMQDDFVEFYNRRIGTSCDGAGCDCQVEDEYGPLTFSNGIIKMENGVIRGTIDIRFPVTMNSGRSPAGLKRRLPGKRKGKSPSAAGRNRCSSRSIHRWFRVCFRPIRKSLAIWNPSRSRWAAAPMRREFITASPSVVNSWAKTAIFTTPTSLCGSTVCFSRRRSTSMR